MLFLSLLWHAYSCYYYSAPSTALLDAGRQADRCSLQGAPQSARARERPLASAAWSLSARTGPVRLAASGAPRFEVAAGRLVLVFSFTTHPSVPRPAALFLVRPDALLRRVAPSIRSLSSSTAFVVSSLPWWSGRIALHPPSGPSSLPPPLSWHSRHPGGPGIINRDSFSIQARPAAFRCRIALAAHC